MIYGSVAVGAVFASGYLIYIQRSEQHGRHVTRHRMDRKSSALILCCSPFVRWGGMLIYGTVLVAWIMRIIERMWPVEMGSILARWLLHHSILCLIFTGDGIYILDKECFMAREDFKHFYSQNKKLDYLTKWKNKTTRTCNRFCTELSRGSYPDSVLYRYSLTYWIGTRTKNWETVCE